MPTPCSNTRFLVNGAILNCKCGDTIDVLLSGSGHGINTVGQYQMNEKDKVVGVNIESFGLCNSANHPEVLAGNISTNGFPCVAEFLNDWQNPGSTMVGNGHAITMDSFLCCLHGEVVDDVTPIDDGQDLIMLIHDGNYIDFANYVENRKLIFDGKPINGQSTHVVASKLMMGLFNGQHNGCSWISTYNALLLLGNGNVHPADIARYFENNINIFGAIGVSAGTVEEYFTEMGYTTNRERFIVYYPGSADLDAKIKSSDVAILRYHVNGGFGQHYVAIKWQYNPAASKYQYAIYNEYNNIASEQYYDSIDDWLEETNNQHVPHTLITVDK